MYVVNGEQYYVAVMLLFGNFHLRKIHFIIVFMY